MRVALDHTTDIEISDWETARGMLADDLRRLQTTINRTWDVAHNVDGTQRAVSFGDILGQAVGTFGEQPTGLTIDNDGMLYFVTDYGHLVRWNGTLGVWNFAPGDVGNGFFRDYAIVPQEAGWALCDGSVTTYLVVGGPTLTVANFTTPNLSGSPAYKKSAAAYTGTINAAGATSSDGAHTHGTTSLNHAHNYFTNTGVRTSALFDIEVATTGGTGLFVPSNAHVHSNAGTTTFTDPATTTDSNGAHTHTTGDPARLSVLPYFKR